MAALRKDPQLAHKTYQCIRLPDGRVGNYIKGSRRPIRDDIQDKEPHGTLAMEHGFVVSCNAYFAQLGTYDVGADALLATANMFGVSVAAPDTASELRKSLPQSSYGQGQVVASPFQLARVAPPWPMAATCRKAAGSRTRPTPAPTRRRACWRRISRRRSAKFMREVVTSGTGRRRRRRPAPMAGKTGTAELADAPSTPGSSASRPTAAARARSRSPCWWKMECTAARPPRRRRRKL